ncbi:MAG: pitrilysin family protein [Pseudomonadota bacterium]
MFNLPRVAAAAVGAFICLSTPFSAQATEASTGPKVTTFELSNGMQGVVIEDHRAPVVTHMVWYKVGAADEPPGQSGIAHFLEHLMFKGTDEIPPGEFSKIIAANGGQDNAFTSLDYTGYFQRIAADRLELVMKMEADRMVDLVLDEESVRTERDVVIEERNSRTDNNPQGRFSEQFNAAVYLNHPYGVPVIGWRHEIEELDRQDALDFYKLHYAPDQATLIVAGDVTPDAVQALAEKYYGPLNPSGFVPFQRPVEPPQIAARRVYMSDEKVRQPYFTRAYLVESYVTAEPGEGEAFAVLAEIFGGGFTSRLSRELVQDQKTALGAGAYYRGLARDKTTFNFYGIPVEGVSLDELEAAADAVLAKLAEEGPTEEELERVKMSMISDEVFQQDSQSSMARMYGAALTIGLTVEDVKAWPDRIRAVTAEDVKAAAASLSIERSVTGQLTGVDVQKAEAAQ